MSLGQKVESDNVEAIIHGQPPRNGGPLMSYTAERYVIMQGDPKATSYPSCD